MSKLNTQDISVLNYNENDIYLDTAKEHYKFGKSRDGKSPSIVHVTLSELQYIANNTEAIVTGWLTFDDELKEEVYKELRIDNWREILTNDEIKGILTRPTMDGLQRIIDIDNQTYFDRVRTCMFKLVDSGIDVTTKVSRIVNQRYTELQKRQRKSGIILSKKDTAVSVNQVKELSEQNAALQSQIDEMKKMMEQMMSMQKGDSATEVNETTVPKKPGKSKKNS